MTETVSFPGLGLTFEVGRVAFSIGPVAIYWYGIFIALGLLLGVIYFFKRLREFGLDADRSADVIIAGILFSVVGGRAYYVLFSWASYSENPASVFYIREGGLAIYGAVIGALLAGYVMCHIRRVKFLPAADLASGSILLGIAIGRWGNFMNVEAFGSNTDAPWGMTSPAINRYLRLHSAELSAIGVNVDPSSPVHPTFLYESLWCLAGFIFVAWFTNRRRFDGQLTLIYLAWYGLGRFFIEGLRTDSLLIGAVRVSQLLAMLCLISSCVVMCLVLSKIRREGDTGYLPLYVNTEEGKQVLAGEFYKKKTAEPAGENISETTEEKLPERPGEENIGAEEEEDGENN